jgi:hypothetical protein
VDLRHGSRLSAISHLARNPAGKAVPGARLDRLLLSIVRVPVA